MLNGRNLTSGPKEVCIFSWLNRSRAMIQFAIETANAAEEHNQASKQIIARRGKGCNPEYREHMRGMRTSMLMRLSPAAVWSGMTVRCSTQSEKVNERRTNGEENKELREESRQFRSPYVTQPDELSLLVNSERTKS